MGWTLTFLICLVVAIHSLPQRNLDDIIEKVFYVGNKSSQAESQSNPSPTQDEGIGAACTQENGQPGECIQYYLCGVNDSIVTDGTGLFDYRKKREIMNEESPCRGYLNKCCGSSNIRDTPILLPITPHPTPRPGPGTNPVVPGGGGNNGGGGGRDEHNVISGCGHSNPDEVGFQIKAVIGNDAKFGEFPWMVAILREEYVIASEKKLDVYICGGSLIHPKVVMTTAHCVAAMSGTPKLKIRAGDWDVQSKREIFPHQDRNVLKILTHEKYTGNWHNDIALLILESPVTYAENIGIVCLPPENEEPPLNAECYVSSWGRNAFENNVENTGILTRTNLTVVPRNKCQEDLRKTMLGDKFTLHLTLICAGDKNGKDTCGEDGGSPLVCPIPGHPNKFMQSGIAARDIHCREENSPRMYAHVASLRSWINEQLHFNNINDMDLYHPMGHNLIWQKGPSSTVKGLKRLPSVHGPQPSPPMHINFVFNGTVLINPFFKSFVFF